MNTHRQCHSDRAAKSRCGLTLGFTASVALLIALGYSEARADEFEDLLNVLKGKGVLTEQEFNTLKTGREVKNRPSPAADGVKAKTDAPVKDEVKTSFKDGFIWETADKSNSIALSGRIQFDYRNFSGSDALNANTFDIRRAYLGARGKFWDDYEFQVVGDFAGLSGSTANVCSTATCSTTTVATTGSSHLDEAYINANWWKQARFRFGQFDMPFSLETLMSDRFIDFMERSWGSTFLAQGKSRGVMVFGAPTTGLYYGLAYGNHSGKNTNDSNNTADGKDVTGRVAANFAEMFGAKDAVYHVGAAFSRGHTAVGRAPSARTDGRGITFFNPEPFTGDEVRRNRYGLEAAFAYGPFKSQMEYVSANFSGASAAGESYDRKIKSYYLNFNWLLTGEHYADAYANGVFGRLRPKNNFSPRGGGLGAWELSLHHTKWDATDFQLLAPGSTNPGTGVLIPTALSVPTNEARGWSLGLKWIANPNTRFLLNYHVTKFGSPVTVTSSSPSVKATTHDEKAITLRAQFDF
jgi:phosphate-selective porin OprO and OprP